MSRRTISQPVRIGKGLLRITVTSRMLLRRLALVDGIEVHENRIVFPEAISKFVNTEITRARKAISHSHETDEE